MTNEDYKQLFDSASIGLWRTNIADGKFLNVNSAAATILGFNDVEDLMQNYASQLHDRESFIEELKELKEIENLEICMKKKDGSTIWVCISAKIFPEKGYLEGSIWDISDRKRQEETFIPHLQKISSLKQHIIKKLQDTDASFKDFARNKSLKIL